MKKIMKYDQFSVSEAATNRSGITRGKAYKAILDLDLDKKDVDFIFDQLSNAEDASDKELIDHFVEELGITAANAKKVVAVRKYFSLMDDLHDMMALRKAENDDKKIESVAKEFSKLLLDEIGVEKLRQVVDLNKKEKDKNICHSHDFCDSNMVMQSAFKAIGIDLEKNYPDALQNESITEIWNAAWNLAKKNDMYIKDMVKESVQNIEVGATYITTEKLNGENQAFPNDYDFESGSELEVLFVDKKTHTVIAEEPDKKEDETWAFDFDEFISKTKPRN
jgi:hypothetical protein